MTTIRTNFMPRWTACLGLVVAGLLGLPREASAQICSAAIDSKPVLCKVVADCPGTDLTKIQPGDPVTITGQFTNTSTYASNPPPNPPAGKLQAGSTIKIWYACTNSGCPAGTEKADWLEYGSSSLLGPAIGNATFADDGNGYSGTLTILNDIPAPEGDSTPTDLVKVSLTAGTRPPVPDTATIFYSRIETGVTDFLITSTGCLSGITGGGQGSTAAAFGPTPTPTPNVTPTPVPTPTPSDVICRPCKHPCASRIFLVPGESLDSTDLHMLVQPPPGCDPATSPFAVGITNSGGTVFADSLPAGSMVRRGRSWVYRDQAARRDGGIFTLRVMEREDPDGLRVDLRAFGDLNSATDPVMTVDVTVCGVTSSTTDSWTLNGNGWLVNFDPAEQCQGTPTPSPVPTP